MVYSSKSQKANNLKEDKNILLNLCLGILTFFLAIESEIKELNFAHNSKFFDGEVTAVIKDSCQTGLRKRSRRLVDCWKIETTASGNIYTSTSFTEDRYPIGTKRFILVAGQSESDLIEYDWVPFFGPMYTRIQYEVYDSKFDPKAQYFESLKSNFGFVGLLFSISLLLFSLRWLSVIATKHEYTVRPAVPEQILHPDGNLMRKNKSDYIRIEPKITRNKNKFIMEHHTLFHL